MAELGVGTTTEPEIAAGGSGSVFHSFHSLYQGAGRYVVVKASTGSDSLFFTIEPVDLGSSKALGWGTYGAAKVSSTSGNVFYTVEMVNLGLGSSFTPVLAVGSDSVFFTIEKPSLGSDKNLGSGTYNFSRVTTGAGSVFYYTEAVRLGVGTFDVVPLEPSKGFGSVFFTVPGIAQYRIYRDGVLIDTTTDVFYEDTAPAGTYLYTVSAGYADGNWSRESEAIQIVVTPYVQHSMLWNGVQWLPGEQTSIWNEDQARWIPLAEFEFFDGESWVEP